MAKVGIYGGSFNPVHFGHVGLAKWVVENTDLDELWLMVSPNNPLKPADSLAPEQERLEAVREAVKDIKALKASDYEFSLPRPSYTADTLRALQKAYPEHEFTLVIGEDNLAIFTRWREYEFILANFRIFVYPRHSQITNHQSAITNHQSPISNHQSPISNHQSPITNAKNVVFLAHAPYFDISSTEIREKK
jgi:nicotinate-nucleotide adenylyltransferase